MNIHPSRRTRGFSVIELLIAMGVFAVISAAMMILINDSQIAFRKEHDLLPVVQAGRVAVDQILRDIHRTGYPSPFLYTATPNNPSLAPATLQRRFSIGFVGLPLQSCQVGSTCSSPNGFDLLMETNPDPTKPLYQEQVQWVEYRLVRPAGSTSSTLMHSMIPKTPGIDPYAAAQLVPYVQEVDNDPANAADPIFTYSCGGLPCSTPDTIQQVQVHLRVRSYHKGIRTNTYQLVTINGMGQAMNPIP